MSRSKTKRCGKDGEKVLRLHTQHQDEYSLALPVGYSSLKSGLLLPPIGHKQCQVHVLYDELEQWFSTLVLKYHLSCMF